MTYPSTVLADSPLHFWQLQEASFAPQIVQSKSAASASNGTAVSVTLDAAPTAGDTIVVAVGSGGSTLSAFTGFTLVGQIGVAAHSEIMIYKRTVVGGDSATISATLSSSNPWTIVAWELSKVRAVSVNGSATASPGSLTPTSRDDLCIAQVVSEGTGGTTPGTGFTEDFDFGTTGGTNLRLETAWKRADAALTAFNPAPSVGGNTNPSSADEIISALITGTATDSAGSPSNGTYTVNGANDYCHPGQAGPLTTDLACFFNSGIFGGGYVEVPTATALNITGDLTLECWLQTDSLAKATDIVSKGARGAINTPYIWFINASGVLSFGWGDASTATTRTISGGPTLTANTWYHLAVTRGGTTLQFYVNGVQYGASGAAATPTTNSSNVRLGNETSVNPSLGNPTLAYVAMWNSALSAAQIAAHYGVTAAHPRVQAAFIG
jgi:hypothetical protein